MRVTGNLVALSRESVLISYRNRCSNNFGMEFSWVMKEVGYVVHWFESPIDLVLILAIWNPGEYTVSGRPR